MSALPKILPPIGLEGIVLRSGGHVTREEGVCAMEALAWLAGENHSAYPSCACPVLGAFMRSWNDNLPDDESRVRLLRPLLPLLLNTKSTPTVQSQRSWMALDWLAREQAPAWLSLRDDLKAHAVALRGLKPITDSQSAKDAQETLNAAGEAARAAAWDAAGDAAWDAARAAAWAAARDAAGAAAGDAAWEAAWDAAGDAAGDAAWDAARAAAWAAARDAAGAALAPVIALLQEGATELVKRMAAIRA